ncbi:hypothetical protein Ahy_B09g095045 [Arachis hypogaea]|uniref:Uncharacterized protein n=1 Tax=Arachis hypogaea TaxID=3818 RepID=A0A444XCU5_ARAHY|nr:hypothetical protein Ahy_B09g095045 [Arachis hypogaea]
MASKLEGGAYLSSFVDAVSKKLSSILEDDDFVLQGNHSARKLLEKLDDYLCDVEPVLDDAELKQFGNDRVKKWLVDLQDALYMADDFLDELSTKAATATPRDPGNSSPWSYSVDSTIEDNGVNVIEKIVGTLEFLVGRKDKLGLIKSAKLDTSWRIPSTSLVVSSDIFESLPDSIGELIHLRYLNLSRTPIVALSESICKLYNLQTLKLRNCTKLEMLPSCMHDLVNLRHLDIRGASCLKEMPKRMSKLKHLNFLSYYIVGAQEENGIRELGSLDNLHGSFCISKLENVKNSGEALEAKMGNKKHINTLKLKWVPDGDIDDVQTERDILDKLQPHPNLEKLSIEGYRGETFPDWLGLSCYSNMTKLRLDRCMNCYELPSLGQLPSLQHLEFSDLDGLEKIGLEFYNKNNASFQQETPFKSLETLKIVNMSSWREWHFPDEFDGFPKLRILSIKSCPVLKGGLPAHLPALEELTIVECEELACSLPRAPNLHQIHVKGNRSSTYATRGHKVVIEETQLAKSVMECLPHIQPPLIQHLEISNVWSAISISEDYLPASLQSLEIFYCSKLTFSEQLQHKSLTKISVVGCHSLKLLPLWDFPNLKNLKVSVCQRVEYVEVPHALPSLRDLCISGCPSLVSLPALGLAAPHLEELDIRNCPKIDCFVEECLPPSLEKVVVIGCQKLARWITSKGLQSEGLTYLWLGGCFDVNSFPREGCLPSSLESLELWNFPNMETLDSKGLHHLTSLKRLAIGDCRKLESVTEEHLLASIANIYIGEECPLRRKLEEMEHPPIQFVCYKRDSDYSDDDYPYD